MLAPALLFCPADRPERYVKALNAADAAIIDLEDAVAPDHKVAARQSLRLALEQSVLDPLRTIVRINPCGTADFDLDLEALVGTGLRTIMLAKTERASDLDRLAEFDVIALCENVIGVQNAREIAAVPHVIALMWGAEDLIASLGGRSSRTAAGAYRETVGFARSTVLFAAVAAGKLAIDAVYFEIADLDGQFAEASDAAAVGFSATACIHPSQVAVVRSAYAPTPEEIRWARAVLHAATSGEGVFRFEGSMVDEPVLRQARIILQKSALAAEAG